MNGNKTDNGVLEMGTEEARLSYQEDTPGQTVEAYLSQVHEVNEAKKKKAFSQVFQNPLKGFPYNETLEDNIIPALKEGTWELPKTSKEKKRLKDLMKKPIPLGKDGDSAIEAIGSLIGDDSLLDDLHSAGKKNPNTDARPTIKKAMKRLGIKEELITYSVKQMQKPELDKFNSMAKMMKLKLTTTSKGSKETLVTITGTKANLRKADGLVRGKSSYGDPSSRVHFDENPVDATTLTDKDGKKLYDTGIKEEYSLFTEAFTVQVPKQTLNGKTVGGGNTPVFVKAKSARQAITMVAKKLGVDWKFLKVGKVTKEDVRKGQNPVDATTLTDKDGKKLYDTGIKENLELDEAANLIPAIQKIVDTKSASKVGGIMVDMFTASVIVNAHAKVNDQNKGRMEKSNIQTLVHIAQKMMGMKEEIEQIQEGKYAKYSDLLLKKQRELVKIDKETERNPNYNGLGALQKINKEISAEMKKLGIKEETDLGEKVVNRELDALKKKFKTDLKKYEKDGYFKNKKASQAFMDYAMDNNEVKTDDPDEFEDWMDRDVLESLGEEEVSEGTASSQIAKMTGTREKAVQQFIDSNDLQGEKLLQKIKKNKKLAKDFAMALSGKPGNKLVKQFTEALELEAYSKNPKSGTEVAKMMMKSKTMKGFAVKVKKMKTVTADQLDKMLPDYISGGDIGAMFEEVLDEGKMGDLFLDIQQGATAKDIAKDYPVSLAQAKEFLKDYYGQKKGSRKEASEGKMDGSKLTGQEISSYFKRNKVADKTTRKAIEIALDHGGALNFAMKEIEKLKRGLTKNKDVKKALNYANYGEAYRVESVGFQFKEDSPIAGDIKDVAISEDPYTPQKKGVNKNIANYWKKLGFKKDSELEKIQSMYTITDHNGVVAMYKAGKREFEKSVR
jgi:hypothetical protein